MIDYVLVTVCYQNKMKKDMELPAQLELPKVCEMLLETLQTAEPMLFSDVTSIKLRRNKNVIEGGTLYDNKVWDGSMLEIIS